MRKLDFDFDPAQVRVTVEEILSDLLYPAKGTGGASAPPAPGVRSR